MVPSRFNEVRGLLVASVAAGLSLPEACVQAGMSEATVRTWLRKGRGGEERYTAFAREIAEARNVATSQPEPMTEGELLEAVSAAAKKGSVQAMKLYWEMLRADEDAPAFGERILVHPAQ